MSIEEYPSAVSIELCEQIVSCFEQDPSRKPSAVDVNGTPTQHQVRSGTMLAITRQSPAWERLFKALVPALRSSMDAYVAKHPGLVVLVDKEGLDCTLPIIERVDLGQGFDWHYDHTAASGDRVVAGLLYLRTVTAGGQTEFCEQRRLIQPEAGKIVLFPPYWTHLHRGIPPVSGTKYVLSYFWTYPKSESAAP